MKNYEIELNKQNLDELFSERKIFLMKQTLLNILSAKGIIYTYYKNKKLTKGKI
jgi:cell division protein FtsL